ncbi:S-layer homology domain-containing protein [Paenibacillus nitricinens]|uniref:S-layer homology domain-containing protein n=1 Tax=Paenibacillus nitricinens TaxID=3367691 RepID=UPI003F86BD4C
MNTLLKLSKKAAPVFLLLAVSLVSSPTSAVKADPIQFSDVPAKHWAKSGIDTAVKKGYVVGYPGGLFMPNANVTRAEFIKMIVTVTGQSVEETAGKWYESYVNAAEVAKLYVSSDFANSELEWNKTITRQEMARIAARATGLQTKENDKWMYLAAKSGLISGLGAGKLGEKENTTRAQSVVTVERVLTVKGGGKLPIDKYAISSAEIAWHKTNIFTVMPEYFGYRGKDWLLYDSIEDQWREDKLTLTSKDNKYVATLHELIAIDLEDPNDPNLKQIDPLSTLKWGYGEYGIPDRPVMNYKKAYLLYWKSTVKNDAPDRYYTDRYKYAQVELLGVGLPNPKEKEGVLTMSAPVYHNKYGDAPYLIIPKVTKDKLDRDRLLIQMSTPNSGYFYSYVNILSVDPHSEQ